MLHVPSFARNSKLQRVNTAPREPEHVLGRGCIHQVAVYTVELTLLSSSADAKFPGQYSPTTTPPSPTRENPGQVYPKTDPKAAPAETIPGTGGEHAPPFENLIGNPYAFDSSLDKLDSSLSDIITIIKGETSRVGTSGETEVLLRKFSGWRHELFALRSGRTKVVDRGHDETPAQGGMFTD
ncbi:uncharacterized protein FIBRA_08145 [Fibroporia radiculosa]|uniref:Uncharacterized protein n=1 Tax=Fibroporia radiculosa TaxID=599839 RepID=J4I296_9APHY|nr:uncharacterized protein FIBRA_08145 [Fibroporia radiculosa]CCM05907.1 predicted protein [Fibroporia radiculosa]